MLVLLLCLVMPLQGVAAVVMASACPTVVSSVAEEQAVDYADCDGADPAMDPMPKDGKVCKVGHECPCGGLCLFTPLALGSFAPAPVAVVHLSRLNSPVHAFPPASVWRPPIQL